ncbi:MAG: hypothetical protein L0Z70_03320 [Chloroflexi bacterium]|nr:hypothetical protein [Chloroflexota bacterium]
MDQPIELVPLLCIRCAAPLPAQPEETAWVCAQCGQGLLLDEESGLTALEVHYAAGIPPGGRGKPYWVAEGRVSVERQTYSGSQSKEAAQFWSQPRRFFVPAYQAPLEELTEMGRRLLVAAPALQEGSAAAFEPVTLSQADAAVAAEFLVMSVEAERKDKLKELNFTLDLQPPVLWILP